MIRFTQDESLPDWRGYVYAVLLFVAAVLQSLFINQYFHRCFTMGMDIRTAVIAAIYSKASGRRSHSNWKCISTSDGLKHRSVLVCYEQSRELPLIWPP